MYDYRNLSNQQVGSDSAGDPGYDDKRRARFARPGNDAMLGRLTELMFAAVGNQESTG
jgi:hypothetical protein